MVFLSSPVPGAVVPVVTLERLVNGMSCSSGRMHVWRIKHNAVDFTVHVRKIPAINAGQDIGWPQTIKIFGNSSPKYALPVGDISDNTARSDIQANYMAEDIIIPFGIGTEHKIVTLISPE
jgi:hypothetical protein